MQNQEINNKIIELKKKYDGLLYTIAQPYKLTKDECETAKLYALWRFVKQFNSAKSKENTYITKCMRWECSHIKKQNKKRHQSYTEINFKEKHNIQFCTDSLNDKESKLFYERYLDNFSVRELAEIYSVSTQTIRNRLQRIKHTIATDLGV